MNNYSVTIGEHKLSLNVLVEKKPDGSFIATVIGLPHWQAEGSSKEQTMRNLRQVIKERLTNAEIIPLEIKPLHADNPWLRLAGKYKDDPLFDEFLADIAAYRRELDAETEAYDRELDAQKEVK